MDPLLIGGTVVILVLIVVFIVYLLSKKKPKCTALTDCSSTVTSKDPNAASYLWDSSCNCNLVSCQTGYSLSNGSCVQSSPVPPSSCTPKASCTGGSDPNASSYAYDASCNCVSSTCKQGYQLQNGTCVIPTDTIMGGFVYYEDNNGSTTAKSMPECQAFCDRYPDCKVYSFDGQNCKIYYDYKSVVGKGGYSDHYLDGVSPDGTVVTGVKPFSSTDPTGWGSDTMGKSQFAWIHGAQIDGTPYKTFPNMLDCVQECRQNDSCQAVARPDSITPCGVYNSIDLRRNIKPGSASFTNNTWVKLKSSS